MRHHPLDPAPRRYSAEVSLIRRSARGPAAAPAQTSAEEIEEWLFEGAMRQNDMLALFESLAWRLVAARLSIDRLSLHVGTLHPQLVGFGWHWSRDDGLCDEIKIGEGALKSDSYRLSPLSRVIGHGETFRADPRDEALAARFPLLADLAAEGFTEYAALPLGGDGYHNVLTVASKAPHGVSAADLQTLRHLRRIFALHVQRASRPTSSTPTLVRRRVSVCSTARSGAVSARRSGPLCLCPTCVASPICPGVSQGRT